MQQPTTKLTIAVRQLATELEIAALQELLLPQGITPVVLKGPHLGSVIYADALERDYCDLDILVRPDSFMRAVALLEAAGYRRLNGTPGRSATAESFYNWSLASPAGVHLELHRELAPRGRYPVDIDAMVAQAREFRIGRVTARGLRPEHLLTHLVIHVLKSYFIVEEKHYRDIALSPGPAAGRQPVALAGYYGLLCLVAAA